jgi:hypothetical protein
MTVGITPCCIVVVPCHISILSHHCRVLSALPACTRSCCYDNWNHGRRRNIGKQAHAHGEERATSRSCLGNSASTSDVFPITGDAILDRSGCPFRVNHIRLGVMSVAHGVPSQCYRVKGAITGSISLRPEPESSVSGLEGQSTSECPQPHYAHAWCPVHTTSRRAGRDARIRPRAQRGAVAGIPIAGTGSLRSRSSGASGRWAAALRLGDGVTLGSVILNVKWTMVVPSSSS